MVGPLVATPPLQFAFVKVKDDGIRNRNNNSMATTHLFTSASLLPQSSTSKHPLSLLSFSSPLTLSHSCNFTFSGKRRDLSFIVNSGDLLGDFGARDPFPAEIESRFGEKVLGNVDTEHKILIPTLSALSLSQLECTQVSPSQPPMSLQDAKQLIRKVVGWRLVDEKGSLKLQCLWKLKDYASGVELINRIYRVVQDSKHYPDLQLERPSHVTAELWTTSIGGLSMNDFIIASKIDAIQTSDLVAKRRAWA